jgi:glutathione S-transferase
VVRRVLDVASSFGATLARLGSGISIAELGPRPDKPLALYEFEACPHCRKVREALCVLDLDALIYPCPRNGARFRPELLERGGKLQFPYLADPNSGREMYESNDIVGYLFETYGGDPAPWLLRPGPVNELTSTAATLWRRLLGATARPSRKPEEPLELYSFESSPYCRIVREQLCTLEIPYLLHNVAKGSPRREAFGERAGKVMVPYLADPNTRTEMFESADIFRYLEETYAA